MKIINFVKSILSLVIGAALYFATMQMQGSLILGIVVGVTAAIITFYFLPMGKKKKDDLSFHLNDH